MKHRIVMLLLAIPLGILPVRGQTLKAYITAAENALAEKDYFTAYTYFETAVNVDSNRMDLQYKLADVARLYQAYSNSEKLYSNVLHSKDKDDYPNAAYWLGKVQQYQGKYDSAVANYNMFLNETAQRDSANIVDAKLQVESCAWAKENVQKINDSTTVERMGDNINTLFSEFGAIQKDSDMYFTRLAFERPQMDKKDRPIYPALLFSEVLLSENDSMAAPLDTTFNDPGKHTAHTAFNLDGSRVYYTLCEYLNKSDIRCDLYYRDKEEDGQWGEAHMMPAPINEEGYTNTQPNIGYDEEMGKEILYFASDRPGGKGNMDIWYCIINDPNNFTQPQPLEAVNTPMNEMTPFYHNESKTLYFSSDGYVGFGGMDIYRSQKQDGTWSTPENVGPDINSSYNDVYYTLSPDEETAHFSSNRLGSTYFESSREACCFDVYEVSSKPVDVNLIVETFNKRTLAELLNTDVIVEARDGVFESNTYNTGNTNKVTLPLKRNKNYTVIGQKDGFDPDTIHFSTYGITQSVDIRKKLYLDPSNVIVEVRTFDARHKEPLPGTTVEIVDKDGGSYGRKTNERSHIQYFGIPPVNTYTVTGTRKGYLKATATINESDFTGDTLVVDLYLQLGNLEDFLPLAIYFDNDQPEPKSNKSTTSYRYLQTYEPYYDSKEKFERRYAHGADKAEEAKQKAAIDDFFEHNLRKSKEEFESFLNILNQYLDEGLTFKIFLKGYASPLASDAYNYNLGQRRIKTIQNEFAAYRNGVLKKYFDSGALEVEEKSYGEETAPKTVSDDPRDLRRSVYSPEASAERRVEIIEIVKE